MPTKLNNIIVIITIHKQCIYIHMAQWDSEQIKSTHSKFSNHIITENNLFLDKNVEVNSWTFQMWSWAYPTILYTHPLVNNLPTNSWVAKQLQVILEYKHTCTRVHSHTQCIHTQPDTEWINSTHSNYDNIVWEPWTFFNDKWSFLPLAYSCEH